MRRCRRRTPVLASETNRCPVVSPVQKNCFGNIIMLIIVLIVLQFLCSILGGEDIPC